MKKKIFVVGIVILAIICGVCYAETPKVYKAQYKHDVRFMSLNLSIAIDGGYAIEGEIFSKLEDNLTLTDVDGEVVREMVDEYNLVSQNDHIIAGGNEELKMVGLTDVFGQSYDIYQNDSLIAKAEFNAANTKGSIVSVDGTLMAQYNSRLGMRDYTVTILENCSLAEEDILMIVASYVSDVRSDSN